MKPLPGFLDALFGRGRTSLRRCAAVCVTLLTGCSVFVEPAAAQLPRAGESQVEAVYLFNFGRFIDWPDAANRNDSFTICVLGTDPFGPVLDTTLAGEAINNRKLAARRVTNTRDAVDCRILFISTSEAPQLKEIVASLDKTNVLTVSDMPGFTLGGGMIQFVRVENKIRFQVNLSAAERAGLTISSQLLKVATDVKRDSTSQVPGK